MQDNENVQHVNAVEVLQIESSLSLITKAEIDVQISTAKAFPRSLKSFMQKAQSMATVTAGVAESCAYALPRGGKVLEGPSVRLAEIVVASYGNVRAGARVIANDGKTITAQGICHDLENNSCVTLEVKRRITDKAGKTFNDDMQVVAGNAACAIAFRNTVFKVIPAALIQDIYEEVKKVARGTAETLPARRKKAVEYLHTMGVKDEQILNALGMKAIDDIDLEKMDVLRGMCTLIKNGESTVDELFPKSNETSYSELKELFDLKRDMIGGDDVIYIERILKQKEVASYSKVHKLLSGK